MLGLRCGSWGQGWLSALALHLVPDDLTTNPPSRAGGAACIDITENMLALGGSVPFNHLCKLHGHSNVALVAVRSWLGLGAWSQSSASLALLQAPSEIVQLFNCLQIKLFRGHAWCGLHTTGKEASCLASNLEPPSQKVPFSCDLRPVACRDSSVKPSSCVGLRVPGFRGQTLEPRPKGQWLGGGCASIATERR